MRDTTIIYKWTDQNSAGKTAIMLRKLIGGMGLKCKLTADLKVRLESARELYVETVWASG